MLLAWQLAAPRLVAAEAASEAVSISEFDFDFGLDAASQSGDDFLLLSPRLDGRAIGNSLTVYTRGSTLFLPLTALSAQLEIGIQLSSKAGMASGFVISQDRPFYLNASKREVIYGAQRGTFNADDVLVKPDDIYVELSLLQKWLPLDFEVSTFGSSITILPREKTPLQLRLDRERRLQLLGGGRYDPNYQRVANPYKLFDGPLVSHSFAGFYSRSRGENSLLGSYSTYLSADVLYLETNAYFMGSNEDPLSDYRLSAGRRDYYGRLLGPLEAREFVLGDLYQPTQPLVLTSRRIRGATISNVPLNRPNEAQGQTLRGNLPPGWSVELYQDGFLADYRKSDVTGQYHFFNVPLHLGNNNLTLVFYGPYGERREETYTYNMAELLTPPGELNYRVTAGQDEAHQGAASADVDLGATDYLTFQGGFSSLAVAAERRNYASFGARALTGPFYNRLLLIRSTSGAGAYEAGTQTQVRTLNLSAGLIHYDPGYSSAAPGATGQLRNEVTLGAQSPFEVLGRVPLDVRFDARRSDYSDHLNYRLQNRLSTALSDFAASMVTSWFHNTSGDRARADGQLNVSRNVSPRGNVRASGELMYLLHPDARPTGFGTHLAATLAEHLVGRVGFTRFFGSTSITDFGISRDFSFVAVALTGQYSHPKVVSAFLQTTLGVGYVDTQKTMYADPRPFGSSGAVLIKAFLDENNNGIWDGNEKAVQKAAVLVNGVNLKLTTGRDGMVFIHSLQPYLPTNLTLLASSLDDPSWQSANPGVSIVPRPGRISVVNFPVIATGFIDGFVYYDRSGVPKELQGARVELWSGAKRVQSTTTEFDGYFTFEKLPAGPYEIGFDEDEVMRLEGAPVARVPISLTKEAMEVTGKRFVIKVRRP